MTVNLFGVPETTTLAANVSMNATAETDASMERILYNVRAVGSFLTYETEFV